MLVALAATPGVAWFAHRWRLVDVPNHRSSHAAPIPRGAGIAVAAATIVGVALAGEWSRGVVVLLIVSSVLGAVGLADDRWGLPPLPRLVAQVLAPAAATFTFGQSDGLALVGAALLAATLVAGYVNAFNFMDGINGIAGLQAAVVGIFLAIVARGDGETALSVAGLAVAGASLGFLPYNVPRATIFLGDVGSYFLGAWLAGLALLAVERGASPLVVVAPFLLYLLDTSLVLAKRARRGDHLMKAHREHVYQRLVALGSSHAAVAGLCAAVTAACAGLALAARDRPVSVQLGALFGSAAIVGVYLLLPAVVNSRRGGAT